MDIEPATLLLLWFYSSDNNRDFIVYTRLMKEHGIHDPKEHTLHEQTQITNNIIGSISTSI